MYENEIFLDSFVQSMNGASMKSSNTTQGPFVALLHENIAFVKPRFSYEMKTLHL